ncbi:hypothetical protein [Azorhizobium doebereinerae]|uniref:hypothetical protein n=1 Tax=Azorhizobium doebereinerae TaxID=281091 RepID=UPI00041CEC1B|nr:hypothetical protein [Azorhizobium doebereinerae]
MRTIGLTTGLLAAVLALPLPLALPLAGPAAAQAPAEAANVVVIAIAVVKAPEGAGAACTVKGQVRQVERGTLFGIGQNVSFAVPCRKGAKAGTKDGAKDGAKTGADLDRLTASSYGRAALDAKGALLPGQYEILDDAPPPPAAE